MIVVAGGSGTLGRFVVEELRARGASVRALVRDAVRARAVLGQEVEVVGVDVRDREGVRAGVRGATVVISAVHGFLGGRGAGPAAVDRDGNANLVAAARDAGAAIVLTSIVGAAADSPLELFRMKHAAEQLLGDSTVPWTVVRATAFFETWIQVLRKTSDRSGRVLVFGRGQQPIPFVSARDVAVLLASAALGGSLRGQVLEVGGPQRLTMTALAKAVQATAGYGGEPRHLPRLVLRTMALAADPVSPARARQARTAFVMDTMDLAGGARPVAELVPGEVSTSLAQVLGS